MDRLAVALMLLGLLAGGWGALRTHHAGGVIQQAAGAEAGARGAQAAVERLQRVPSAPLAEHDTALDAFALRAAPALTALGARIRLTGPPKDAEAVWRPLRAERVEIQVPAGAAPLAVAGWLGQLGHDTSFALTRLRWDGRTVTLEGAVLGR